MANPAQEKEKKEEENVSEEKETGQEEVNTNGSADGQQRGYAALLNLDEQPHWTVFLSDFALPAADRRRLQRQVEKCASRLIFIRIGGVRDVLRKMRSAGADLRSDYFSVHAILCRYENLSLLDGLVERLPRGDLARIDVPVLECGFRTAYATRALRVVMNGDYTEQDRIADRFFNLLAKNEPYAVTIETAGGRLHVHDRRPWFELAGRLREGETRTLPDGEVAYAAGEIKDLRHEIEGRFVVDGAVLPLAQEPRFAADAQRLLPLSREVEQHPFCLDIRQGTVVSVTGNGRGPRLLSAFFDKNERYRRVNEVGISFNRASTRFIHGWAAASNEVRPGVHIGIGGAANPDEDDPQRAPFVHLDCIAANCSVFVNGHPFLRAVGNRSEGRPALRAAARG